MGLTMSQKLITLPISNELYEHARKVAEVSDHSTEEVLAESLKYSLQLGLDLPPVEALRNYPTVQLWSVALSCMSEQQVQRMRDLNNKNKEESLTESEKHELDHLLDLVDQYMLLHSEALVLLKERGEDVNSYLKLRA